MKTLGKSTVEKQHEFSHITGGLTALLSAIKLGAKIVRRDINKAGLVDTLGANDAENVQGEVQQKLNLLVSEKLKAAPKACDIAVGVAPEEEDEVVVFEGCEHARYVALMDPLDGSSNVDANVSTGTTLSIYYRVTPVDTPITEKDFLQSGNKQVAIGYMVYDSSTILTYTIGYDVHAFTHDPSLGVFCPCQERMRFPEKGKTYSINEGDYIRSPNGARKYIRFRQEEDKSTNRPYVSRYTGSLVASFRRNLLKGGIHLHSSTASHPDGKPRLLYGCNPMILLAEQAGGKASDGRERILDIILETLHQRCLFSVGNDRMVENVERFICEFLGA